MVSYNISFPGTADRLFPQFPSLSTPRFAAPLIHSFRSQSTGVRFDLQSVLTGTLDLADHHK